MTIDELLTHEVVTIDGEHRIECLTPTPTSWERCRCHLGRFVYYGDSDRETATRLIRDADAVFVRTEVTQ